MSKTLHARALDNQQVVFDMQLHKKQTDLDKAELLIDSLRKDNGMYKRMTAKRRAIAILYGFALGAGGLLAGIVIGRMAWHLCP